MDTCNILQEQHNRKENIFKYQYSKINVDFLEEVWYTYIIEKRYNRMTKQEFKELTKRSFTDDEYEIIEKVYTFYPTISNTEGKKQIAYLYDNFGMCIIKDMSIRASKTMLVEQQLLKQANELEETQKKLENLKKGVDFCWEI